MEDARARVVVNDLGGDVDGSGGSVSAAELVSQEIIDNGGQAISNGASVSDIDSVQNMIDQTMATWGRIDMYLLIMQVYFVIKPFQNLKYPTGMQF